MKIKKWQNKLCLLVELIFGFGACWSLILFLLFSSYYKAYLPEIAIKSIFIPIIVVVGFWYFRKSLKVYDYINDCIEKGLEFDENDL